MRPIISLFTGMVAGIKSSLSIILVVLCIILLDLLILIIPGCKPIYYNDAFVQPNAQTEPIQSSLLFRSSIYYYYNNE